jgi:histone deacetylase 1/2
MEQPFGFVRRGGGGATLVCLLNKALYGLKQAGRAWQHALFDLLREEGYQQSLKEPCVWFRRIANTIVIIAVYVDDVLITGDNTAEINRISSTMGKRFKMKDLGEIRQFLGIEARHLPGGALFISQEAYAKEIVSKYQQEQC